jgi:hypothetical protein
VALTLRKTAVPKGEMALYFLQEEEIISYYYLVLNSMITKI